MQMASCKCVVYLCLMLEQMRYLALFNHGTMQIILGLTSIGVYLELYHSKLFYRG